MSANDLADRLDRHAAELDDAAEYWNAECDDMRAASALLREQAEQLDTLRHAIGDPEALRALADGARLLGSDQDWLHGIADAVDALAAAGGGVPETCACGKPATGTVGGIPTCGDDR